jgi:hypothetical protein
MDGYVDQNRNKAEEAQKEDFIIAKFCSKNVPHVFSPSSSCTVLHFLSMKPF